MEAGLRPGAKATEWPPDPKAGAPPADPTQSCACNGNPHACDGLPWHLRIYPKTSDRISQLSCKIGPHSLGISQVVQSVRDK